MRLLFLLGLLIALNVSGQGYSISGIVIDVQSGEELMFATAVLESRGIVITGAVADWEGNFKFEEIPAGSYLLKISFVSYESYELEIELVRNLHLGEIELKEKPVVYAPVPVWGVSYRAIDGMASSSSRSFGIKQVESIPGNLSDPARLALSFPGVKGSDDITGALSIRGNSPKGVVWRVDGIEIPTPSHFSTEGGVTGSVSMISSNFLGHSDFYSGAFPAQIGNAISGAFDLRLRNGSRLDHRFSAQVGMLGVEAGAEGPFKKDKNHSYNLNYRYSTLGLVGDLGFNIGETKTAYQDYNFKSHFNLNDHSFLDVFSIGGISTVERSIADREEKMYSLWLGGLKYFAWKKAHMFSNIAAYSVSTETYNILPLVTEEKGLFESQNRTLKLSSSHQYSGIERIKILSGLIYTLQDFSMKEKFGTLMNPANNWWAADDLAVFAEAFSQFQYTTKSEIEFLVGIHGNYFFYNNTWSIEPRLGVTYLHLNGLEFTAAAGIHSRLESMGYYMNRLVTSDSLLYHPNKNLDYSKAAHFVAGVSKHISKWHIGAEVYYQYLFDVPVSTNSNSLFSAINYMWRYPIYALDNDGTGLNYGIDFSVEKEFYQGWFLLCNMSAFRSFFTAADGIRRASAWDANFITNFSGGKEFPLRKGRDNIFTSGRLLWSGGYRLEESAFEESLPDYLRLDLRIAYTRDRGKLRTTITLDIQNVTNRLNENITDDIDPVGLIPVLAAKLSF
ncbi:MAG: hypothetical protein ACI909_003849 [Planctomycetota bacterium]|jgi:hypothetical protein